MKKKYFDIIILQIIIIIYTLTGIIAKKASAYAIFSFGFVSLYSLEIFILGVYAILWQQMLKKFEVSIAYANRSVALIWSLVWSVIFFNEVITINNIIGTIIVILGIVVVNLNE